jgi:hypothetical protein
MLGRIECVLLKSMPTHDSPPRQEQRDKLFDRWIAIEKLLEFARWGLFKMFFLYQKDIRHLVDLIYIKRDF